MPEKRKPGKSPSERGRIIPDFQLPEKTLKTADIKAFKEVTSDNVRAISGSQGSDSRSFA